MYRREDYASYGHFDDLKKITTNSHIDYSFVYQESYDISLMKCYKHLEHQIYTNYTKDHYCVKILNIIHITPTGTYLVKALYDHLEIIISSKSITEDYIGSTVYVRILEKFLIDKISKDINIESLTKNKQSFRFQSKLNDLPRDSSRVRIRNRCAITGRSRGFYRKFNLSRIKIREYSMTGILPGVIKASW